MDLIKLYESQMKLEQIVRENIGMTEEEFTSVEMIDKRIFAFKVELGELANEHGWFKYWKQSHLMDRDKTLEELVDCVHFLLAIGIYRKYARFVVELNNVDVYTALTIKDLYTGIMERPIKSAGQWKGSLEQLVAIGIKLGYSIEQIELAYYSKNRKNIERQQNNY